LIVAGQNSTQNYQYNLIPKYKENPEYLSPRYALEFLETNQVGILSELFGIKGEGFVIGGASATGNVGLIKACQSIRSGLVEVCLVVGVIADLSPMDIQGFINIGAMGGKKFINHPEKACRPFDYQHEGFIYGQAGACIILESESSAYKRGVPLLAEIKGSSFNLDGNSSADPNVDGEIIVMIRALEQSGFSPSEIDYLNTHGSSSPLGDETEAEAICHVFGNHINNMWINATKGLIGHCLYSAGIAEVLATVLQMEKGFLHPNKNLDKPINDELKFCGAKAINHKINIAMSNSFGFGGINTSIVLHRR
jgi:malonyl-ACP decarboxylase